MRITLLSLLGFALSASFTIQAGPPLICHPYDIGSAQSLPWGHGHDTLGFDNPDQNYNTKQLTADTLKILDAGAPVIVRMEAMRRAALYGSNDHPSAATLLGTLKKRAEASSPSALVLFDYGYFAETLKQIVWKYKEDLTRGADGYSFVKRALTMQPDSADMHFAAAVMTRHLQRSDYLEHASRARAAKSNALLVTNIHSHLD